MKAIETQYKGCWFRSRLEARWAVFFDALGLNWEYEKQGFVLDDGSQYLPDFYLPEIRTTEIRYESGRCILTPLDGVWLEIKGEHPTLEEYKKLSAVEHFTHTRGIFMFGGIPDPDKVKSGDFYEQFKDGPGLPAYGDCNYMFCICPECGKIGIEYWGRAARICHHGESDKSYNYSDPKLLQAYAAARSARFEFGNSGAYTR